MSRRSLMLAALFLVCVVGCDAPARFDGSSREAAEASIERLETGMSENEKTEFREALLVIALDVDDESGGGGELLFFAYHIIEVPLMSRLDGKTSAEIIEAARAIGLRHPEYVESASEMRGESAD